MISYPKDLSATNRREIKGQLSNSSWGIPVSPPSEPLSMEYDPVNNSRIIFYPEEYKRFNKQSFQFYIRCISVQLSHRMNVQSNG